MTIYHLLGSLRSLMKTVLLYLTVMLRLCGHMQIHLLSRTPSMKSSLSTDANLLGDTAWTHPPTHR